jgi:hypothetical protein
LDDETSCDVQHSNRYVCFRKPGFRNKWVQCVQKHINQAYLQYVDPGQLAGLVEPKFINTLELCYG